jgi:hypothetical protein
MRFEASGQSALRHVGDILKDQENGGGASPSNACAGRIAVFAPDAPVISLINANYLSVIVLLFCSHHA